MFIGITNPDNADKMTTSARPNSVPDGTWPTKYGSRKMYSDTNSSGNNNPTKIAIENAMYFGFEKTSFMTFNLNHRVKDLLEDRKWLCPYNFLFLTIS